MLSVDEALQLVLNQASPLPPVGWTDLDKACGCVLAEQVISDIDSPPHDKSIVDGYAVVAADITPSGVTLAILEEVTAGATPTRPVERGTATRIMTGAPLPQGADAVVMVEKTETSGERVRILQTDVRPGQNIMSRAGAMYQGQTILSPGRLLRPIEIGLLAEVGRSRLSVIPRPRVAIIATGNELVEAAAAPLASQIRNSNGPLLRALASQTGGQPFDLGIARDTAAELRAKISEGLSHDVVLLSGGVSAGVLDLVPQVLTELGVEQIFHKVNLKPGKPLWFGVKPRTGDSPPTLVFGLPGNPVSTLVCFELFVRPAIQQLRGLPPTGLARTRSPLTKEHRQRGDRPTYWPALVTSDGVTPLPWQGSGDLCTLTGANCLAYFPAGEHQFAPGDEIECLLFSNGDS